MPVALIPKKSSQSGYKPNANELQVGEIALNTGDGALYAKLANNSVERLNPSGETTVAKTGRAFGINLILG